MQVVVDLPEFTYGETMQKVKQATEMDAVLSVSVRNKGEKIHSRDAAQKSRSILQNPRDGGGVRSVTTVVSLWDMGWR